jgi:polygalacturonase
VDNGNYLTGTIQLRSHVELHLTSTAALLGFGDLAKYHRDPKVVYKLLDRSLVYAEGCDQIAITLTVTRPGGSSSRGTISVSLAGSFRARTTCELMPFPAIHSDAVNEKQGRRSSREPG